MAEGIPARDEQKQLKETVERKEKLMDSSPSTKKHRLVEKAIPNIANAIKTVVSLSKNENFKGKCFNLVKVKDEDEFSKAVTKRLWNIATSKLNVKTCDDGDSQIVPDNKGIKPPVDEANKKATVQTAQNDALSELSREDYFDDLAGEISFYEDLCNQGNCPSDHDAAHPATCGKPFPVSEEHEVRQKSSSVNVQELPCSAEKLEKGKPLPITKVMPDITSPKAKLRCCESTFPQTRKPVSSKDWLQEFAQDFFWMENDETPTQKTLDTLDCYAEEQVDEAAHLSRLQSAFQGDTEGEDGDILLECTKKSQSLSETDSTISNNAINGKSSNNVRVNPGPCAHYSKQQDRVSPSSDTLSQCTTSSDDFDDLAELSFI